MKLEKENEELKEKLDKLASSQHRLKDQVSKLKIDAHYRC